MSQPKLILFIILIPLLSYAQTDCWNPIGNCVVSCGERYSGFIARGDSSYFKFTTTKIIKVTFTNCDSFDFDPSMQLFHSNRYIASQDVTNQSDGSCNGYNCVDDNYVCSNVQRETFTFSYLGVGDHYIRISNPATSKYLFGQFVLQIFCGDPGSRSIIAYEKYKHTQYPGSTLLVKGFNIFTTEKSGSPILELQFITNNTEYYTTEGTTCSYTSLEFNSQFSFYSSFAKSDSEFIAAEYSILDSYGAGGSLSTERTETRSIVESGQYYIYSMNLGCITGQASIVEFDKLFWNINFINALRILPTEYTTDNMHEFVSFWNVYGTHLIESANFGGSIRGAVVVNKCAVEELSFDSNTFEACLNGRYKGISMETCKGTKVSSSKKINVSSSIENTHITLKGGDTATYGSVFNAFGDKEQDFELWINGLATSPDIVGGNLVEIHEAILRAIKLGNHSLNRGLSKAIDDETYLLIATALETAYKEYSYQLSIKYNYFDKDECNIDCNGKQPNITECVCSGCGTVSECCPVKNGSYQLCVYEKMVIVVIMIYMLW